MLSVAENCNKKLMASPRVSVSFYISDFGGNAASYTNSKTLIFSSRRKIRRTNHTLPVKKQRAQSLVSIVPLKNLNGLR